MSGRRIKYKIGTRWGKLVIVSIIDGQHVKVQCDCGSPPKIVLSTNLPRTASCKCVWRNTHGQSQTDLYHVWDAMKQRCLNPRSQMFHYYGGRGITICDEWKMFESFFLWAHSNGYQKGLTIERIDNDLGYNPGNCSWVPMSIQSLNKRKRGTAT